MSVGATSTGSYRSRTLPRPPSRGGASVSSGGGGGGGGVEEADFEKAFSDVPSVTVSLSLSLYLYLFVCFSHREASVDYMICTFYTLSVEHYLLYTL